MPRRFNAATISLGLLLVAAVLSGDIFAGGGRDLDVGRNLGRFLAGFLPPDLSILPDTGSALVETVKIAVWATILSAALSFPFALLGSRRVVPRVFALFARVVLGGIRTIPSLIWALLAVAVLGPTPLAGVVALTLYSIGYLGTFAMQDAGALTVSRAPVLRAAGASRFQAFLYGIWPEARPLVAGRVVWMFEYNVRSAAVIGYVGAGGIGSRLYEYQEFGQWNRFATVLMVLFLVVMALDVWGERLRATLVGVEPPTGD